MKTWQRRHHHHHNRLAALLIQYKHLTLEQKIIALEEDLWELAKDIPGAVTVLDKIAERLRVHR